MKKNFIWLMLIILGIAADAQQYNNEWIKFNQTYYKFKVGSAGVYRIPKSTLDNAGIGNVPVEFLEIWRNGRQVYFYPSVQTGILPANGFLEIWGEANDGESERVMYRDPADQHTQKISLLTDTAVYFLSVNTDQSGFRYTDEPNDVASSGLPVEPYFIHTVSKYFNTKINLGRAAVVGEYVYSAAYDKGEFWSTADIRPSTPNSTVQAGMLKYTSGPDAIIRFGAAGNSLNPRSVRLRINGTLIKDTIMDYFNDVQPTYQIPLTLIDSVNTTVQFLNTSLTPNDRMVISYYEIDYPRRFQFANRKTFDFTLPAKAAGYLLHITNFSYGTVAPVLYDLTNGKRYTGDISVPTVVRFALPGSTAAINYILVNEEASNSTNVPTLTTKNFTPFTDAAQQGNYLIITHPYLFNGTNGNNPIQQYSDYRSSAPGGSNTVKVIDVNELIDQFGFGIKKHPMSVKNFIRFARDKFSNPINYIFLMGRGMVYNEYREHESDPIIENLNLVPTFGTPASDNMLSSADVLSPIPVTPIGRLSAVNGKEVEDYLEKIKEYEDVQQNSPHTIAGRGWMKNVVHVTGSSDPNLGIALCNYMSIYKQIVEDTLFGGRVSTFCKTSTNPIEQLTNERIQELFAEGISILTYYGHSSSTTLEFNIDNPQTYNNQGKYPVFFVNGCNAGNFFTFYPQRLILNETLSEKFVFAKQRGSIAFVASTHFGIVNYLNIFLTHLYTSFSSTEYGNSIGIINKAALQRMIETTGQGDFYARLHAEEITIHGDPSLKLNVQKKPDYIIEESLININPSFISIAEDNFQLKIKMVNLGKAVNDSITVEVKRTYPDNSVATIFRQKIRGIHDADSLMLDVPIVGSRDKGVNKITVTVDSESAVDEITENNNTVTKEIFIFEDEARPVYPYDYGIVNNATQKLYASTANPFSPQKDYIIEIDTTEAFNSS
ncbi:MAG TPA: C25 family cysteine peptidase, partial [Flavitalea sp.]|nr:C25 family cysteine peptidase [Flavitalea sp.]